MFVETGNEGSNTRQILTSENHETEDKRERVGPDLVVGSGIEFDNRGVHAMKGVPGKWRLFALRTA